MALLCATHLDQMFLDGHLGYAGALRGVIGRNYLRADLIETRLAPLQNGGPSQNAAPAVRANHPPLAGMLVGLAFAVAGGASEAAARAVPLFASVLTLPLLFGFVRRIWDEPTAAWAVLLWSLSPFVAIWGAMPSYEPLVLCAWLLLLRAWALWRTEGRRRWGIAVELWAAIILGLWVDWPMVVLTAGLIGVELILSLSEHPRRWRPLLHLSGALGLALTTLAVDYFLVLDVDHGGLESLYQARSSLGRWSALDVALHISHRTARLLTWPIVAAAALGVGLILRRGRRQRTAAVTMGVGLLLPPVILLVSLPQHAVIHCFSSWYLLPAAVIAAALAIRWLGLAVKGRWRAGTAAPGVVLAALVIWAAIPVVLDGWISDGSPLEGRPRMAYRHLALARWAGAQTDPDDLLVIDPSTDITGVRAWFQHDRAVRRLGLGEGIEDVLRGRDDALALIPARRLGRVRFARLAERYQVSLVGSVVVIDARRPPGPVRVLEFRERRPSWWWLLARSATVPPHRLVRAPGREEVYARQLGGEPSPALSSPPTGASLAELAARHLLAPEARPELEATIGRRLTIRLEGLRCGGAQWVGARAAPSPGGRGEVSLLLRAGPRFRRLPPLEATLHPQEPSDERPQRWTVVADDLYRWPPGALIVSTHRLASATAPGRYRLEVRGCGRRSTSAPFRLDLGPAFPVHPPVGRL